MHLPKMSLLCLLVCDSTEQRIDPKIATKGSYHHGYYNFLNANDYLKSLRHVIISWEISAPLDFTTEAIIKTIDKKHVEAFQRKQK